MEKLIFALKDLLTEDIEFQKYQVLSTLKKFKTFIKEYKIYPTLSHLQEAKTTIENLIHENFQYELNKISMTEENSEFDFINVQHNETPDDFENNFLRKEFLYWIVDEIESLIDEAEVLEQFVLDDIRIEKKGEIYDYRDEGIFVIKNTDQKLFDIYYYNLKLSKILLDDRSAIETKLLTSISYEELNEDSEKNIIFGIARRYFNQSKITVWEIDYGIDFPFEETILPAALECLKSKII